MGKGTSPSPHPSHSRGSLIPHSSLIPFSTALDVLHHQHTEEFETTPADAMCNDPHSCMQGSAQNDLSGG